MKTAERSAVFSLDKSEKVCYNSLALMGNILHI